MVEVIHQWIRLNDLHKLMKSFFFKFVFKWMAENQKMFKRIAIREYWSNCNVLAIYQWIRLDKLYKLIESFFQISESFFELTTFFLIIVSLGLCKRGVGAICSDQHAF